MAVRYRRIAQVVKTRKKEGRMVVRSVGDLPFLLYEGMKAYLVPPLLKGPRLLTVASIEESGGIYVVSFDEIDSIDVAEELVGHSLLVEESTIDQEMLEDYEEPITGFCVLDVEFGDLGQIVDVVSTDFQDTLVIEGQYGSVLIPYVEQFVNLVDYDAERVEVAIPRGLLELQSSGSGE